MLPRHWRERRARVPTVLQMEAVECGAAALAMVLAYFGRFVPLEELRVACGVSRDGSKASNLLKGARRYGLVARGYRREPSALGDLPLPMVVHWNFNHFVVLEGLRRGRVFLNDPAAGPRVVSFRDFDEAFTGVVLTFEPSPDFERGGIRRRLLSSLRPRLARSYAALAYVVGAGLLLVVPGLVVPTFSRVFVDDVLVRRAADLMKPLFLAMVLTIALLGALTWLQHHYLLRLETRFAVTTSSRFLWHVLHLPMRFFSQRFAGDIGSRVAINDRVAHLLSGELAGALVSTCMAVFYAAFMWQYDRALSTVAIATAGLNVLALKYFSAKRVHLNQQLLHEQGTPARHGDGRPAGHRDAQGDGGRVGLLRKVVGLPGQGGRHGAAPQGGDRVAVRGTALPHAGKHGVDSGHRRIARDGRGGQHGNAGGLSGAHAGFHHPGQQDGRPGEHAAGGTGGHRQARRRVVGACERNGDPRRERLHGRLSSKALGVPRTARRHLRLQPARSAPWSRTSTCRCVPAAGLRS